MPFGMPNQSTHQLLYGQQSVQHITRQTCSLDFKTTRVYACIYVDSKTSQNFNQSSGYKRLCTVAVSNYCYHVWQQYEMLKDSLVG